jgi:hypothetical protein
MENHCSTDAFGQPLTISKDEIMEQWHVVYHTHVELFATETEARASIGRRHPPKQVPEPREPKEPESAQLPVHPRGELSPLVSIQSKRPVSPSGL